MIPEAGFYIAGLVKAAIEQQSESGLGCRTRQRGEKGVPLRGDLRISRQAIQVHQTFGLCNRVFVKGRDPHGERFDERVEFVVRQIAIDIPLALREIPPDIV